MRSPIEQTGWTKEGSAMALSNDEQRTLDEIERALRDDDPTFVNAVSLDHLRRHRAILGGFAFLLGMVVLVVGEVVSQALLVAGLIISLTGFMVMFSAIAWTFRGRDHI
jgi:Protein of unknown function (DUF3040)